MLGKSIVECDIFRTKKNCCSWFHNWTPLQYYDVWRLFCLLIKGDSTLNNSAQWSEKLDKCSISVKCSWQSACSNITLEHFILNILQKIARYCDTDMLILWSHMSRVLCFKINYTFRPKNISQKTFSPIADLSRDLFLRDQHRKYQCLNNLKHDWQKKKKNGLGISCSRGKWTSCRKFSCEAESCTTTTSS